MRLFLLTALLLASASTSWAYTVDIGSWQIRYFSPGNAAATGCIMGGDFRDGTRLSVIVSKEYEWALGLINPKWNLRKDGATDVAVYVDQQFVASGKATHLNNMVAVLPLSGVAAFRALQTGQGLVLQTPRARLAFALSDTAKAMSATLDCVKTLVVSQPRPQGPDRALSQEAARALVTNIFNAAGITAYRLEPPKEGADGTNGIARVEIGVGPTGADDRSTHVRKVIASCRTGTSVKVTETTIIRRIDGLLIQLSLILPDNWVADQAGRQDRIERQ